MTEEEGIRLPDEASSQGFMIEETLIHPAMWEDWPVAPSPVEAEMLAATEESGETLPITERVVEAAKERARDQSSGRKVSRALREAAKASARRRFWA